MIVALIILDRTEPKLQDKASCLLAFHKGSVLEHMLGTVLRGPFGGTIVALHPDFADAAQEQLSGFAAHPLVVDSIAQGPHAAMREGLAAAAKLRERWEKAMAAAASRFAPESESPAKISGKKNESVGKAAFSAHRASKDVKIRGLARSFDRDGVILFSGEYPAMSLELQAQLVEAFGREGADKGASARPYAQAVHQGKRGYPILMSLDAAREVSQLSASTDFDAWLLQRVERIQDVTTDAWGAVAPLRTVEDYAELCRRMN